MSGEGTSTNYRSLSSIARTLLPRAERMHREGMTWRHILFHLLLVLDSRQVSLCRDFQARLKIIRADDLDLELSSENHGGTIKPNNGNNG